MAFNPGIDRDEEEDQNQKAAQQGGTDQLGGGGGVITGATAQEGAAQKGKGSGFTNIGQYLDANKDDIPNQTNQAVGKVGEKYTSATNSVKASQDAFNTTADQNRGAYVQGATNADEARKTIADNLRNDTNIDENDQKQWASYANSQYKGPKELDNSFQPEATEAKDWSNTLATSDGYFPMMGKMFGQGRSDYNNGMQRLDGSLISADKNARSAFEDFNKNAAPTLDATVDSARQQAVQKAGQYQTEADMTKGAARAALEQDVLPEYMKGLVNNASQLNQARRFTYGNAIGGGPVSETFNIAQQQSATQSPEYKQVLDRINGRYDHDVGRGIDKKRATEVRDADLAKLNELVYNPRAENEVRVTGPDKKDYMTYGGDLGLGSLDPAMTAKLEALYGMSGNGDLRNTLEKEAGTALGFDDIYRNGSGEAVNFDKSAFDSEYQTRKTMETQRVRDWEAQIKAEKIAQQQKFLDDYMNHGGATAY